jgi:dipeptidyl aminopeptidase/acylaminoacyl peptidase
VPVVTFQGLEDAIVPPSQSEQIVNALRKKKIPCAYVTYEGEQHGFRKAENMIHSLESELYFYSRVFGFEPADDVEPIDIENL